jgi:hypothetical protein
MLNLNSSGKVDAVAVPTNTNKSVLEQAEAINR